METIETVLANAEQKAEGLVKQKPVISKTETDHFKVIASYQTQLDEMKKIQDEIKTSSLKVHLKVIEACQVQLDEMKKVQANFKAEVSKFYVNDNYIMFTVKQGIKEQLEKEMVYVHSRVDTAIKHTLHEDFKVITDCERDRQEDFYKRIFGFMDKRSVANAVVAVLLSLIVACVVGQYAKPDMAVECIQPNQNMFIPKTGGK